MNDFHRGFTLIELLVVVAMIGIISLIATVAVANARNKAFDAGVKANMENVLPRATLYYHDNDTYGAPQAAEDCTASQAGDMFFDNTDLKGVINQIVALGGVTTCAVGDESGNGKTDSFAISSTLKTGDTWCVDSGGSVELGNEAVGGDTLEARCN